MCQIPRVESSAQFRGQRRTGFTSRIARIPIANWFTMREEGMPTLFLQWRYIDVALMTRAIKKSEARVTCEITRCATRPSPSVTRLEFRCKFTGLHAHKITRLPRDRDRVEIHTHTHTHMTHNCRYNIPSCGGGADITVKLRYLSGAAVLDGVYLIEGYIYIVMLIERINAPSIIRRKDARKTRPWHARKLEKVIRSDNKI